MKLKEIITKLDKGYFEVLQEVSDSIFVKLINDLATAKSNPDLILKIYSSELGVDLYDTGITDIPTTFYDKTGYTLLSFAVLISSAVSAGIVYEDDIFGKLLEKYEWDNRSSNDTTELIDKFGSAIFLDKLFHYYWYCDHTKKAIEIGKLAVNIYQDINLERFEHILRANLLELLMYINHQLKFLKNINC